MPCTGIGNTDNCSLFPQTHLLQKQVNLLITIHSLENPVTYSAGNGGQNICGVFSESARLQRFSTPQLKAIRTVGHFRAESAHVYLSGLC